MTTQTYGFGDTKARGPGFDYLGAGEIRLRLLRCRMKDGVDFIAELELVADAVPYRGQCDHQKAGASVSWFVGMGGSTAKRDMAKQDIKGLLVAISAAAGRDQSTIPAGLWDQLFGNLITKNGDLGAGIELIAYAHRGHNKATGEQYKIPSVSWAPVQGQVAKPAIFAGFGLAASPEAAPAAARPGPRPGPAAKLAANADPAALQEVEAAIREFAQAGYTPAQLTAGTEQDVTDLRKWGVGLIGGPAYADACVRIADLPF